MQSPNNVYARCYWIFYVALILVVIYVVVVSYFSLGSYGWAKRYKKSIPIPRPKGWPIIGNLMDMSVLLLHYKIEYLSFLHVTNNLMAFRMGSDLIVIALYPNVVRDSMSLSHFTNRPLKK
jgi:hypothetical protein